MLWIKKGKSYFDYFEAHALLTLQAAQLLNALFSNGTESQQLVKKIKDLEHQADQVAHEAYNQLNSAGFILPIDREDIRFLLRHLDDVIDFIDDSSEAFGVVYELTQATDFAKRLCQGIVKGTEILCHNCQLIRKSSQNSSLILTNCISIHKIENEADDIKKEALHDLFSKLKEEKIPVAQYLAWTEIYHTLETVSDKIEDCADISEQFVLKYG